MIAQPPDRSPDIPAHVAVIMDGNGRWAQARGRVRSLGHRVGLRAARRLLEACRDRGVDTLTVFAFSQENWQRPATEVGLLMRLFQSTLRRELDGLHDNGIRLRFIGEHSAFPAPLRAAMREAEALTADNRRLRLQVAVGYGGQWDILQAARAVVAAGETLTAEALEARLSTAGLPAPDLLIRTGGEYRISNFMLWQLAYTELYVCDCLWPDFDAQAFDAALAWYAGRQRRFGRVI